MQFVSTALSLTNVDLASQESSRPLPGSLPPPSPGEGRGGLAFMELNGWRTQNLNRPHCATSSKETVAGQGLWSGGKHSRGKGLVLGGGGGGVWRRHPCSEAHKITLTHRCKDTQHKCVELLCVHSYRLSRTHCHIKKVQCSSLWCPPVFVPEAKSHTFSVFCSQCNVSQWMPLMTFWDLLILDFGRVFLCLCQTEHHTQQCTWAVRILLPDTLVNLMLSH